MEGIQQERKPDGLHVGLPIEEEVRAIVAREKIQGNNFRGIHRPILKSVAIASCLARLFTRYGIESEADTPDTMTI